MPRHAMQERSLLFRQSISPMGALWYAVWFGGAAAVAEWYGIQNAPEVWGYIALGCVNMALVALIGNWSHFRSFNREDEDAW